MHIRAGHLPFFFSTLYTTLIFAHPTPLLDFTLSKHQQEPLGFSLSQTTSTVTSTTTPEPSPPVQLTISPFSPPPPVDLRYQTGPLSGELHMHSTLSHHIPLSFTLVPITTKTSCTSLSPPTLHLLSLLSSELRSTRLNFTSFPVKISQSMKNDVYQAMLSISLTKLDREEDEIAKEDLEFLVLLVERSVQALERAVVQRGAKGLVSVGLEGEVDGMELHGSWEVKEFVDGVVVSCEG